MAMTMMTAQAALARTAPAAWAEQVQKEVPVAGPIRLLDSVRYGTDKEVLRFRLGNGLQIILLRDMSVPLVTFHTWFGVGSRVEHQGRTGIAHLFEHLMFKGTKAHPHEVFDRLLEEAGARNNAATWMDWTCYYEDLPASELALAVRLESDRMTNLELTQALLDAEREVVKNEREFRVEHDPDGKLFEELFRMVYPTHPYGHPTLGTMEDLDRLTLQDCLTFYKTYYGPSNATLVVVGAVDPEETLRLIARAYGDKSAVELPPVKMSVELPQTAAKTREMHLAVATERVKMAWRAVPADHPDAAALDVVTEVLFANESSRLDRILLEELQIASDVDGSLEALALDGIFLVDVVMNEGESARKAYDIVRSEIARLGREGPTEPELARARNHLESAFQRSLSSFSSRATQLGGYHLTTGDYRRMFTFVDRVQAVTASDVRRVIATWLAPEKVSVIFGLPAGS